MAIPRLEINLEKIDHNINTLIKLYGERNISICAVTKVICGNILIAELLIKAGITTLADSKIENLRKMRRAGFYKCDFLLLGPPMLSESESIVINADISLNTEISVIEELSKSALNQGLSHKIILMVESGDLREGIMPEDLENVIKEVLKLKGVELVGIGTNLACVGGVQPDVKKMKSLSKRVNKIEKKFALHLPIVSGGNSANYNWFMSTPNIGRINSLRLGESIFLGREATQRSPIPGLFLDAFILVAEVTELKTKPSLPDGTVGQNAYGETLTFQDNGLSIRAILGIGLQEVPFSGLKPITPITILGGSSDHMIIDPKQSKLKVGDEVRFNLNYAALLSTMTSPYVSKVILS